jgi:isopenicillin N synthase-like dioxygenase
MNQWVDVPPLYGSLVVNIGDVMQVSDVKFKYLSLYNN